MSKENDPLEKNSPFFPPVLPIMNCTSEYWLALFSTFLQIVASVAKTSVLRI